MWWWTRRWFQPAGVTLSWRGVVLEIARWPVVLWAVLNVVFNVSRSYMITPKGDRAGRPVPGARLYGLYVGLAWLAIGAVAYFHVAIVHAQTQGYLILVLFNAVMILALLVTTLALEVRDLQRRSGARWGAVRMRAGSIAVVAATGVATAVAVAAVWQPLMEALR